MLFDWLLHFWVCVFFFLFKYMLRLTKAKKPIPISKLLVLCSKKGYFNLFPV